MTLPRPPEDGLELARRILLTLPEVEEGTSHCTPAFRIHKKLLARLREDGVSLVGGCAFDTRDDLMAAAPETFYITDHYAGYPAVLIDLATVAPEMLQELLEAAWKCAAPKRLVARFETPTAGRDD